MKQQSNSRKLQKAVWHRDSDKINSFCESLNRQVNEFNKKNKVVLCINHDINYNVYFEKVFFEETKSVEV